MAIRERFVAVPHSNSFFLADIAYWAVHEPELDEWCAENNCERQGMIVKANTDYAYTMFILRWS